MSDSPEFEDQQTPKVSHPPDQRVIDALDEMEVPYRVESEGDVVVLVEFMENRS